MPEREATVAQTSDRLPGKDLADADAEATDGCRYLIPPPSQIVRQSQRVKPDPETNPLADLDWEKEPKRVELPAEPTRREGCTFARR